MNFYKIIICCFLLLYYICNLIFVKWRVKIFCVEFIEIYFIKRMKINDCYFPSGVSRQLVPYTNEEERMEVSSGINRQLVPYEDDEEQVEVDEKSLETNNEKSIIPGNFEIYLIYFLNEF